MEGQVKLGLSSSAHLKQQHPDHPWHLGGWLRKDKNPRNPPAPTHHLTPTWQTQPPTKVYGPVEQRGPDHSQRSSDPAAGAGVPSLGALLPGSPSPFGLSSVRKGRALISPWQAPPRSDIPRHGALSQTRLYFCVLQSLSCGQHQKASAGGHSTPPAAQRQANPNTQLRASTATIPSVPRALGDSG